MDKKRWQLLEIEVSKAADGTWCISCDSLPMFHAVGETEEKVYENAKSILTKFLEMNYPVNRSRVAVAEPTPMPPRCPTCHAHHAPGEDHYWTAFTQPDGVMALLTEINERLIDLELSSTVVSDPMTADDFAALRQRIKDRYK